MSYGRSPLFEPQPPPAPKPSQPQANKPPISPIAHYVGEGNMPLVWTLLAIVAFVAFVIFYIMYNPLPDAIGMDEMPVSTLNTHGSTIESVPAAGTPKYK